MLYTISLSHFDLYQLFDLAGREQKTHETKISEQACTFQDMIWDWLKKQ